jgi:hypothetical protein
MNFPQTLTNAPSRFPAYQHSGDLFRRGIQEIKGPLMASLCVVKRQECQTRLNFQRLPAKNGDLSHG